MTGEFIMAIFVLYLILCSRETWF